MDLTGLGSIADLATGIIGKIWPDKTEQEKAQIAATLALIQGQMDVNRVEAANPSVFVSGWRPFIGWVCGMACAWNWVGLPLTNAISGMVGHPLALTPADLTQMLPLLLGMLGLGALRTTEKLSGVAAK